MDELENLRQIARQRLGDVTEHVEIVHNFVEDALTLEQLDRVIELMDNCFINAQFILNPPQQPPPPPQQPLPPPQEAVDDNMDAESGTTD